METRYTVRQAADMTGVKAYVLRYWEDELNLHIHRNEMGHRYYTRYDIRLFMNIKELKNRGLQLRAIRELLPKLTPALPELSGSKICVFSGRDACAEQREEILEPSAGGEEAEHNEEREHDEKILEFQAILERLIAQELRWKNEDEERCRSLDVAIRRQQAARKEAAAAGEKKSGKRGRRDT